MGTSTSVGLAAGCGEALCRLTPCYPLSFGASAELVASALAHLESVCAGRALFRLGVVSIVAGRKQSNFLRIVTRLCVQAPVDDSQALAKAAAERISYALYRAYRVTSASRAGLRSALGVASGELPLAVSVFMAPTAPEVWARGSLFQPIIDRQLEQLSPSLVAFGLASASPDPARPSVARYTVSALTLGVAIGSPIQAAIANQLCGRGASVLNPADPADQPTLNFASITDAVTRSQILNVGVSSVNTGAFAGVSPTLEARHAARLLPLPQLIGQVTDW